MMMWFYCIFSAIALIAYAKLFIIRKRKNIDLQEMLIFLILHAAMTSFIIRVL